MLEVGWPDPAEVLHRGSSRLAVAGRGSRTSSKVFSVIVVSSIRPNGHLRAVPRALIPPTFCFPLPLSIYPTIGRRRLLTSP